MTELIRSTGAAAAVTAVENASALDIVNEVRFQSKIDIGVPGTGGGLDVGEGGSYKTDKDGTTIIKAFTYDASADGGTRFTEVSGLDTSVTWLKDQGDRFYVGSTKKFWGVRFNITTGKSNEKLTTGYWNGSDVTAMDCMGILKTSATSTGNAVLEQTAEKEYVTWDHVVDSDWAAVDNQTDKIPNTGTALFWMYFEIPSGGIATALVIDEIRCRGTDLDVVSGASYIVFWGQARIERHERISLSVVKSPGGTTTASIDIDSAHKQTVFDFDGAGDNLSFMWTVPEAIDTSSKIEVKLGYSADAADTYDIDLSASTLKNATAISSSPAPDYTSSTAITPAAGATFYSGQTLMATKMSIADLAPDDVISFELQRTDTTNSFYPMVVTIHYIVYATGEHV